MIDPEEETRKNVHEAIVEEVTAANSLRLMTRHELSDSEKVKGIARWENMLYLDTSW